ncbi:type II toxin-antitoxin system HicA family toxin [Desulfoscipio geothermicus]|uniref:Predicted RNA binding protein YcfA, dsRBD-like fold, HicA-like mRNA interferase family n=1 Tax=Desulfoscipio geothermicus DSM 3669 TaxID=1121426 RepID=A0A1I6E3U1_9FIRM|nr:type II toxin-antitoxin system HicA family toxin [Desulfoscipio geothermicus]SFR12393.1 Predicted RNA binding protein YcfA, dsRBD-like fold, HicA-like mRNA interferase family [Desulfoscipio geothermicus DSM 3669]
MAPLPVVSGRSAVLAFEKAGWKVARQKGSHIILVKAGMLATLSIPNHKVLDRGLLRSLIRKAEMSVNEFVELLD